MTNTPKTIPAEDIASVEPEIEATPISSGVVNDEQSANNATTATSTFPASETDSKNHSTTAPEKKAARQKGILELIIEQSNTAATAEGNQQNSTELLLQQTELKQLSVNVNSTNQVGAFEEKMHFTEFEDRYYRERCNQEEKLYVDAIAGRLQLDFKESKVLVINNLLPEQNVALALLELMVLTQKVCPDFHVCSCTPANETVPISAIIDRYKQYRRTKGNKGAKGERIASDILIIYYPENYALQTAALLQPLTQKGGIADAFLHTLKLENLHVIVLGRDRELYKAAVREKAHFTLVHISKIHLQVFSVNDESAVFVQRATLIEKALGDYGWLKDCNSREQEAKVIELLNARKLETELQQLIDTIDLEENKLLKELMNDSLHTTVLFVAAYFKGISLSEFDRLVRVLVPCFIQTEKEVLLSLKQQEAMANWNLDADRILATCGICAKEIIMGEPGFQFERPSREMPAYTLLQREHPLYLFRSIGMIQAMVTSETYLGEIFLEKFLALVFRAPASQQEQTLLNISLSIATQLIDISYTEHQLRILFQRLLFILRSWSGKEDLSQALQRFYRQMTATPFRRNVLGALLSEFCTPSNPEKMDLLRLLLNSTGDKEFFIKFKLPRRIVGNYINALGPLQVAVEGWIDLEAERPPKAFSFFKSSLLLLFYEKRFAPALKNSLDYRLVGSDTADLKYLSILLDFLFSNNSTSIFYETFENNDTGQPKNSRLMEQQYSESLYTVYAFILIRCQYLLQCAAGDKSEGDKSSSTGIMKALLLPMLAGMILTQLRTALQRAIREYNDLMMEEKDNPENKKRYKTMRDGTRTLVALVDAHQ